MIGLEFSDFLNGFKFRNITYLAKAITYCESSKKEHQQIVYKLINELKPISSKKIGITGTPGVGKSTYLENFGLHLIESQQAKVAILAIDPTSHLSGGSILGDKTRMQKLSAHPDAFVRPSPSRMHLGGASENTLEAIFLCERFGFDYIFVETVGVGQSEVEISNMVDFFKLLISPLGGDELQAIKRGILEVADLVVVNKADGKNKQAAEVSRHQYQSSVDVLQHKKEYKAQVLTCSSIEKTGFIDIEKQIQKFYNEVDLQKYRQKQKSFWVNKKLLSFFQSDLKNQKNQKIINEFILKNDFGFNQIDDLYKIIKEKI